MRELPLWAAFFSLGALVSALNAFLLKRMIARLLRSGRRTMAPLGGYLARMALAILAFGLAAGFGQGPAVLVCAFGFSAVQAFVLVRANRGGPR